MHARVADYEPEAWQHHAYGRRQFFDWGGAGPVEELPYFRRYMVISMKDPEVAWWTPRGLLTDCPPYGTGSLDRDFDINPAGVDSYRAKDSAVALTLWRMGEVMIHDRNRFERVYDLTERIAPAELIYEACARTERFMMLKNVARRRRDRGTYRAGRVQGGPARASYRS